MRSRSHRNRTLADLEQLIGPALATGQFSVARQSTNNNLTPVGAVFWASVSPAVDERLTAEAGKTITLKPEEWRSGDIVWLMEAIGEPPVIAALLNDVSTTKVKRQIKVRTQDKDGKVHVRMVAPTPSHATTSTAQS